MRVEPDAREAAADRAQLVRRMRSVLDRAEVAPPGGDGLRHPAAVELVHVVQRALRSGELVPEQRRAFEARFAQLPVAEFGPAEPRGHLDRSVARALRSVPGGRDDSSVVSWSGTEPAALARAVELLARAWPEAAAELRESVVEVALLDGGAIDGFTDFTTHGAVLVHRARLADSPAGLPGPVRFAEALVHEGAHTRCNAAAVADPFLAPDPGGRGGPLLVATPLRADPRPLAGLFQQAVVLARSVQLYRRLPGLGVGLGPGVEMRLVRLLGSAREAVDTLGGHSDQLTDRGRQVLAQCAAVIGAAG